MIEILFTASLSFLILVQVILLFFALKKYPKLQEEDLPSISVIVAARDEEENILDCLISLYKLEYDADKIEIIMVDDNSSDGTNKIISDFIKDKKKFKLIKSGKEIGQLKGKTNALANALEIATGEVIFTTDADCTVKPTWAKTLASYYTEDVGAVFGYTHQSGEKPFFAMQGVDSIYLLTGAAGAINMNAPMSCIGNNMSYRREAYDAIGGYESIPFSVTEDFRMLKAIAGLKKYKLVYPVDINSLVTTKPCDDLKTLYRQRKRWSIGGLENELSGVIMMTSAYFANLVLFLTPFFFNKWVAALLLIRLIADWLFIRPIYKRLNLKFKIYKLLVFEIYYVTYSMIIPPVLLFSRKVVWKGKKY